MLDSPAQRQCTSLTTTTTTTIAHQSHSMSHYPRRRITITGCILLGLGLALLRLPLDQKSYARESAKMLRGVTKTEKSPPKGGMVRLSEVKALPVNHDGSGAMKQVMILNGQVPHLTGFTRAVFVPGDEVETHSHKSMDEVFYGQEGKGIIEVDGTVVQILPGTCVHVSAGQNHRLKNTGDDDMVLLYFGVATEPATDGGGAGRAGGKRDGGGGNALHAINA